MKDVSRNSDREVLESLRASHARWCENRALLLAHLGEIEARGAYRPRFDSLLEFCLSQNMDEDEAPLFVSVAPVARRFPTIFERIADGRLHLEGAAILAPHLDDENALELLEAATHKTESQIRKLLSDRGASSGD